MSREKYIQFVCVHDHEGVMTFNKIDFQINWNDTFLKYRT